MDLSDLLKKESISLSLKSVVREDAIRELVDLLASQGYISDCDEMYKAVMAREKEFSTGIGMGIAIPHAKSSAVNKVSIAFGRSGQGVDWPTQDKKPAHLLFLIAVPIQADNQHLRILAKLSRKLVHDSVRERITFASSPEEVINVLGG